MEVQRSELGKSKRMGEGGTRKEGKADVGAPQQQSHVLHTPGAPSLRPAPNSIETMQMFSSVCI